MATTLLPLQQRPSPNSANPPKVYKNTRATIIIVILVAFLTAIFVAVFTIKPTWWARQDIVEAENYDENTISHLRRVNDDIPHGRPLWDMPRRRPGAVPYGQAIFTCANPGQIALGFDDGPSYWTTRVMEELDNHDVKGTFFITGNNPKLNRRIDDEKSEWPELLREMHDKGHQLASHTWTHKHLEQIGHKGVFAEMVYNEMAFRNVLGLVPTYMRPPYGVWRDTEVQKDLDALGYHIMMYNIDTKDYVHNDRDAIQVSVDIFNNAVREDGNGTYLVLVHDIYEWTALKLLPAMLRTIKLRGYKAVTVGECLNDQSTNWYRDPASEDW
ncbi:hypothetical protein F5Y06DRAFT_300566 [Hypoxylon sp. FL0890]|nr:hypothetical protein F5Y06DRAFT_300566 [Hypoxylon sp. FL0890]